MVLKSRDGLSRMKGLTMWGGTVGKVCKNTSTARPVDEPEQARASE
jgi:hypothetical protein